jgi:hypothetical protein
LLFIYIYLTRNTDFAASQLDDYNLIIELRDDENNFNNVNKIVNTYNDIVLIEKISVNDAKTVIMYSINLSTQEKLFALIKEIKKLNVESIDYFKIPNVF